MNIYELFSVFLLTSFIAVSIVYSIGKIRENKNKQIWFKIIATSILSYFISLKFIGCGGYIVDPGGYITPCGETIAKIFSIIQLQGITILSIIISYFILCFMLLIFNRIKIFSKAASSRIYIINILIWIFSSFIFYLLFFSKQYIVENFNFIISETTFLIIAFILGLKTDSPSFRKITIIISSIVAFAFLYLLGIPWGWVLIHLFIILILYILIIDIKKIIIALTTLCTIFLYYYIFNQSYLLIKYPHNNGLYNLNYYLSMISFSIGLGCLLFGIFLLIKNIRLKKKLFSKTIIILLIIPILSCLLISIFLKGLIMEGESWNKQVGNNKDEYGCIVSAGYTWCEIKNKCLRTWEEPCDMVDIPSTDGWTVYIDNDQGFKFKYPENLKTDNLSLNQWPPRIDIKKLDSENFCKTDDEKIETADGIICGNLLNDYDKHDNRYYNVNYAYKFTKNNIEGEISFTIDHICYSNNCIEDLQKSFDTNKLMTEIFNTIEFFDTNEENNNGTIEGSLSCPSDYIPEEMRMCAVNIDTKEEYWTSRHIENDKYRYGSGYKINVPAGNYYVFANISRNMRKDYYKGESHEIGSSTNPYMLTVKPKETIFIGTVY